MDSRPNKGILESNTVEMSDRNTRNPINERDKDEQCRGRGKPCTQVIRRLSCMSAIQSTSSVKCHSKRSRLVFIIMFDGSDLLSTPLIKTSYYSPSETR